MSRNPGTMHGYYETEVVLPTYGAFAGDEELAAYERHRRRLFTDKLTFPPRMFAGARLLEFGPDSGENSLVFAQWGADCTLVEPHPKAHPFIRDYFDRFGLGGRLAALETGDVESYPEPADEGGRFDVVDAEGFIYTIQPTSLWARKFSHLVREDGYAVIQYVETFGSFLELAWKVVQARYRELTGLGPDEATAALFGAKWASIPHKRRIESWTMDVLENPFVRLRYFLEPNTVAAEMGAVGFRLYSSWPRYDGGLDVHWSKHEPSADEQLEHQRDFVVRSRLSHMFGRRHFLADLDAAPEPELRELLEEMDALVDGFDSAIAERIGSGLERVAAVLGSDAVIARADDGRRSLETVAMVRRLLEVLAEGSPERIAAFCNTDEAFIGSWGMPSHFAIYRRTG